MCIYISTYFIKTRRGAAHVHSRYTRGGKVVKNLIINMALMALSQAEWRKAVTISVKII